MLATPKTPKRVGRANYNGLHTPRYAMLPQRGPMPMANFQFAAMSLSQHITLEEQAHCPVSTPAKIPYKMFNPEHTSTPASIPLRESPKTPSKHLIQKEQLTRISDKEESGVHEELALDPPSPPSTINLSPEPRPSSAPISNRALFQAALPPRPRTTEPVESKQAVMPVRDPPRRHAFKPTFSKTPHCARPTISWLNRIKGNQ